MKSLVSLWALEKDKIMQQQQSQKQITKKQLSFTSMKPPFGGGGDSDYRHFSSSAATDYGRPLPSQEPDEVIVAKTPPVSPHIFIFFRK